MLLATWNVNSLKARLPRVLEFLGLHQPDILCLQETKCAPEALPRAELAQAGYAVADHSAGRWAGVAIATPIGRPAEDVVVGLPGEARPEEARWIEATVDGIRVVSTYVPNGRSLDDPAFQDKLVFLQAMAARVSALEDESLVLAGDLNIAPADIDVYSPAAFAGSTHTSAEERAWLARIQGAGLVDSFRRLHPDSPGFTWWDYRAGHFHRGLGLRIDLVLVSPDLAERLVHCGIDREFRKGAKPSDHAPLLVEFD